MKPVQVISMCLNVALLMFLAVCLSVIASNDSRMADCQDKLDAASQESEESLPVEECDCGEKVKEAGTYLNMFIRLNSECIMEQLETENELKTCQNRIDRMINKQPN